MSYSGNTLLIARPGYGSAGPPKTGYGVANQPGMGAFDWLKDLGSKVLSFYGETKASAGREEAYKDILKSGQPQASMTPPWLLPAAVLGGIGLFIYMRRRRRSS
jgi:hypothetical protein